jgi:hypothetical protein
VAGTPETLRLVLEIDLGIEPIRGVLGPDAGVNVPFSGLLELVHLLDEQRGAFDPHRKDGPG